MPYAPWPADGFPQTPTKQGFSAGGPLGSVVVFEAEAEDKRRRRHTADRDAQTHAFEVTTAQAKFFRNTYFKETLAAGSLPFLWQGPLDDEAFGWEFDAQNPYSLTPIGGGWWTLAVNVKRLP